VEVAATRTLAFSAFRRTGATHRTSGSWSWPSVTPRPPPSGRRLGLRPAGVTRADAEAPRRRSVARRARRHARHRDRLRHHDVAHVGRGVGVAGEQHRLLRVRAGGRERSAVRAAERMEVRLPRAARHVVVRRGAGRDRRGGRASVVRRTSFGRGRGPSAAGGRSGCGRAPRTRTAALWSSASAPSLPVLPSPDENPWGPRGRRFVVNPLARALCSAAADRILTASPPTWFGSLAGRRGAPSNLPLFCKEWFRSTAAIIDGRSTDGVPSGSDLRHNAACSRRLPRVLAACPCQREGLPRTATDEAKHEAVSLGRSLYAGCSRVVVGGCCGRHE
jgi:hypothetical protein